MIIRRERDSHSPQHNSHEMAAGEFECLPFEEKFPRKCSAMEFSLHFMGEEKEKN